MTAAVIVVFVLSFFLFLPDWAGMLVILALTAVATWEFYSLLNVANIPNFRFIGLAGGLLLQLTTWYTYRHPSIRIAPGQWQLFVLLAVVVFVLLRAFSQKNNDQLIITIAGTLLGILYVPFLFNFMISLLMGWGWQPKDGRYLILFMLLVVKWSDAGAYFVGCSIGKHKMIPRISPGKTWEGTAGGITTGLLVSFLFYFISKGSMGVVHFTLLDALLLGLLLPLFGTLGDLTESLFKRAAGMKDSSRMVRGMGGLLDVLDSLLFTAPLLYVYAKLFLE